MQTGYPHAKVRNMFKTIVYIFAAIGFVMVIAYAALELGFTKTSGIIDNQHDYFKNQINASSSVTISNENNPWEQGQEWQVLKEAIIADKDSISSAAKISNVPARMIVSLLIVEQLRLFHSNRELFKEVFAPLKILANQSQFSWGVMGVKQDTAKQIEDNLKNPASSWYLGPEYSHILDFATSTATSTTISSGTSSMPDPDTQRFNRLTDEHNRYYSYLYAGLFMKEVESQWQKSGIQISDRPDIVATLYDIGFDSSHPHANPLSGGAEIDIGTTTYSFGSLAGSFYESEELIEAFPR
jgi:hypothetical protein